MILSSSLPGCVVDQILRRSGRLIILAHVRRDRGRCPDCGAPSSAVHRRYVRHPADYPSLSETVMLRLKVRRFGQSALRRSGCRFGEKECDTTKIESCAPTQRGRAQL
ncbi:transposase family protein [Methylobacterium sp. E-045]|uniref:transposase family protein n=1 Tax=Methylobacterium sp. E-045 TaxID=2836575 RepID=UPI003919E023